MIDHLRLGGLFAANGLEKGINTATSPSCHIAFFHQRQAGPESLSSQSSIPSGYRFVLVYSPSWDSRLSYQPCLQKEKQMLHIPPERMQTSTDKNTEALKKHYLKMPGSAIGMKTGRNTGMRIGHSPQILRSVKHTVRDFRPTTPLRHCDPAV